ncbi:MAG: ATP-binding cassette domain-containing protein [Bacteroidetes bacterium]|jgi:ABC-2 type transport system ATP-binding protein|nr:ATP-binding cassette domain-containing protein [Bacteroidota bacterium]
MSILSIKNVTKNYATHKALDEVSLEVPEGSIFGLLGPNGAGKTSLIRIINQITAPDSGEIYFMGSKLAPDHVASIGYLPEERGLYKKMEVGEQALYLAQLKGMSRSEAIKRLRYWFEKFEMKSWWKKKIEELSKGMQQKVQFIVTILHEPKLLILDEPFTGFDPINANIIKDELLNLREKGSTIILSTHRMESVEELCTHIALINKSKKVLDGPVKDVRKQFRTNLFEVEYNGTSIGFANALWAGFELIENKQSEEHHFALVRNLNHSSPNDLLKLLINEVEILSFKERIPGMNDIFIESVKNSNQ